MHCSECDRSYPRGKCEHSGSGTLRCRMLSLLLHQDRRICQRSRCAATGCSRVSSGLPGKRTRACSCLFRDVLMKEGDGVLLQYVLHTWPVWDQCPSVYTAVCVEPVPISLHGCMCGASAHQSTRGLCGAVAISLQCEELLENCGSP